MRAPNSPSETEWQNTVIAAAELHRWLVYHTYDSRRSQKGFPDLVLVRGRSVESAIIFAELKTDEGRLTPTQRLWRDAIHAVELVSARRIRYALWRPRDWLEVERTLRLAGTARETRQTR